MLYASSFDDNVDDFCPELQGKLRSVLLGYLVFCESYEFYNCYLLYSNEDMSVLSDVVCR